MCLITISYKQHPAYPLIIVQNRDESYSRESLPIHIWDDFPEIIAGRDTLHGGTWAGMTKTGRIASLTNRPFETHSAGENALSRGKLVKDFLTGQESAEDFLRSLKAERNNYDSYQLMFGTVNDLHVYSNASDHHRILEPGLHSLSNTDDDISAHKVDRSLDLVGAYLKDYPEPKLDDLLLIFRDAEQADDLRRIPEQVSTELAYTHSSIFIKGEQFGTVNTTALSVRSDKTVKMKEYRYDQQTQIEATEITFQLSK